MHEIRPTIKVIKSLPRDSFPDPTVWDHVRAKAWTELILSGLQHPLLDDARKQLRSGLPDKHRHHSKVARQNVYEVRDRASGWRGAVIFDDAGDPWLVYADEHDRFNSSTNRTFAETDYLPTPAEYKLRAGEEKILHYRHWSTEILLHVCHLLTAALRSGQAETVTTKGHRENESLTLTVAVESDEPAKSVAIAHESYSLTTLILTVQAESSYQLQQELLGLILPFLQPDPALYDSAYDANNRNSMVLMVTLSQARLAQLTDESQFEEIRRGASSQPLTRLHYVGTTNLTAAYVEGRAVRAVCGIYFVPT